MPHLIWNASASAPLGFYWVVSSKAMSHGDLVLADLPPAARMLAAKRQYLPLGVPLVKRVAALTGDTVCSLGLSISINGRAIAQRLPADSRGRALPAWQGCRVLSDGDVFLLMREVPDSFDGRYFGVTQTTAILGKLVPLWTW
ncbi:MAG TPA: S26 family signal peptidase [Stellaceae bacterium]|nr:S26 family signal peptidase [Stellaceae bacterium]